MPQTEMDTTSPQTGGTGAPSSPNGHVNTEPTRSSGEPSNSPTKSSDQPRQKRKKARRACYACQRAHLTCGDERPCQRCIKRGLEADCQDGVRKKAKYLHDAPNEALVPGAEQNFRFSNNKDDSPVEQRNSVGVDNGPPPSTQQLQGSSFQQDQSVTFQNYSQNMDEPTPMSSQFQNSMGYSPYGNQPSPMQGPVPSQPQMAASMQAVMDNQPFEAPIFDVNDHLFNFDVSGMNFGNHYGALEFGMLGQMSSAVNGNTLQRNNSASYESPSVHSGNYVGDSPDSSNFLFNPNQPVQDFRGRPILSDNWALLPNIQDQYNRNDSFVDQSDPYAMAPISLNAPATNPQSNNPDMFGYYEQPVGGTASINQRQPAPDASQQKSSQSLARGRRSSPEIQQAGQDDPSPLISKKLDQLPPQPPLPQRLRDPSSIYSSVTKPYPYTTGFHTLTNILVQRFSSSKRLRIAQALASIRPSFISCTRNLTNDDLIFMEKCFQRQLWEYEDFIEAIGTPTIVCRRTGEVAYVAPEFCLMTGWDKSVLLGNAPNLNVNKVITAESNSGTRSGSSRGGMNTPLIQAEGFRTDPASPQPVFLAELLDADSVVEFYEDFAKLAFADSKGSCTRPCKVVKYKTKEDQAEEQPPKRKRTAKRSARNPIIHLNPWEKEDNHKYLRSLGDKQGKVDCMFSWTVKRDVFDIPMMIVLNFLPMTDP